MKLSNLARQALLAIGLGALVVGLALVTRPELATSLPSTYAVTGIIAIVALVMGFWMARTRWRGGLDQSVVPDPELPLSSPAPGHDLDEKLYQFSNYRTGNLEFREQIRDRLGNTAISVVMAREGCSREDAIQHLESGAWTDDAIAASFFSGGAPPQESLVDRILGDGESPYEQWVRHTVDALVEYADLEPEEAQPPESETRGSLRDRLREGLTDRPIATAMSEAREVFTDVERNSELVTDGVRYWDLHETGRWRGITAFALIAAGVGIFTLQPAVLLASVVGVGFSAYARTASEPPVAELAVSRTFSDEHVQPGEEVEVTVTVENAGDSFLPDLRLIDRVPMTMEVRHGSPRIGTALQPGSSVTFSYTLVAERGEHDWPLMVAARDVSGALEREATIDVEGTITCMPSLSTTQSMPVRAQTSVYSGRVDTPIGGSGIEFFSVRDYRPGDPMKRVHWGRLARTGNLATIDFREERATRVVLLFDTREAAYVSQSPAQRHAVDRSVEAAGEVFASLFDNGDLVGVAAFDTVPCWLGPGAGDGHRERARRLFAQHPALSSMPPELSRPTGTYVDPMVHVRRQLSPSTQIIMFSPLCDDYAAEVARRLNGAGHLVTVVSPNPTGTATTGQRLSRVERSMRVNALRERGIRVIDWAYDEILGLALEEAQQRWAV